MAGLLATEKKPKTFPLIERTGQHVSDYENAHMKR